MYHCRFCRRKMAGQSNIRDRGLYRRGLCWVCYAVAGIRNLYPPTDVRARRGVPDKCGNGRLPPHPTDALPGTEEKVAVLAERAEMGVQLHHPQDARCC